MLFKLPTRRQPDFVQWSVYNTGIEKHSHWPVDDEGHHHIHVSNVLSQVRIGQVQFCASVEGEQVQVKHKTHYIFTHCPSGTTHTCPCWFSWCIHGLLHPPSCNHSLCLSANTWGLCHRGDSLRPVGAQGHLEKEKLILICNVFHATNKYRKMINNDVETAQTKQTQCAGF